MDRYSVGLIIRVVQYSGNSETLRATFFYPVPIGVYFARLTGTDPINKGYIAMFGFVIGRTFANFDCVGSFIVMEE